MSHPPPPPSFQGIKKAHNLPLDNLKKDGFSSSSTGQAHEDSKNSGKRSFEAKSNLELVLNAIIEGKKVIPKEVPVVKNASCLIPHPQIKNKVFFEDVAPIINNKCSICHNPKGIGPMDFITYKDVAGRRKIFQYVIEQDLMPPWFLDPNTGPWENDLSLTVYEKSLLLKWMDGGFLRRSNKKDTLKELYLKQKGEQTEEEFDYIIQLPETVRIPKGFKVKMFSDYKTFMVQTPFKEDKWIKTIKMIAKPKVVHHFEVFIMRPNLSKKQLLEISKNYMKVVENSISYFVVGNKPSRWQQNTFLSSFESAGTLLPKGSSLYMSIHYEYPEEDIVDDFSHIKINFHKKPPVYKTVIYGLTAKINIPPFEPNYISRFKLKLKHPVQLVTVSPHMHFRGISASFYITEPDSQRKKIFSTNPFLRKFESTYKFKKPLFLKKGTEVECRIVFDNSINNPDNPDPSKSLTFGFSKYDEMSQCWLRFKVPANSSLKNQFFIDL